MVDDAADLAAEAEADRVREEQRRLLERSQAIQRGLPRPTTLNPLMAEASGAPTEDQRADKLIKEELLAMLRHDALAHPVRGGPAATAGLAQLPPQQRFTDEEMAEARFALAEEIEDVRREVPDDVMARLHAQVAADYVFLPSQNKCCFSFAFCWC